MARAETIQLAVITPERQVLDTTADAVVIPAHDGELGILRDRAPLMCELGIGQLRYTGAGRSGRLFIDGGFAQVLDNRVMVLTARALTPEQITPAVLQAADQAASASTPAGDATDARTLAQQRSRVMKAVAQGAG